MQRIPHTTPYSIENCQFNINEELNNEMKWKQKGKNG
jgi:hypothetical protein